MDAPRRGSERKATVGRLAAPPKGADRDTGKVRRLVVARNVARTSRAREEFPAYHDPVIQLAAVALVFVGGLAAELATQGKLETVFQVAVIASGLIGAAVLLRSVRNGWNVEAYRRARKALQKETTSRIERDALRESSQRFAELLQDPHGGSAIGLLQALTDETRLVLDRDIAMTSVTIAEQIEGRFLVICVAGYMRSRPYHVAPGKSCEADRPFPRLLESFAPHGQALSEEVKSRGRTFWVGVTSKEGNEEIDPELVKTLGAWVVVADSTGLLPRSVQNLLRVG